VGKPLIHSAGAGLSLAAAGTTVLLGASAMVAFNGWPGMRENVSTTPVRLAAAPPPLRESEEGAAARRPVAVRLRSVPARSTRARARMVSHTSAVAPARNDVRGISVSAPAKSRSAPARTQAPAPQAPGNAPAARRIVPTPAGEQLEKTAEEAVAPVATVVAPVATAVNDVVDRVGGVVQGLSAPRR
jgi:hypothetical protein